MGDDLNVASGLALVWKLVKDKTVLPAEKHTLLLDFDRVLGLNLCEARLRTRTKIPREVEELAKKREELRKAKKWQEADKLRFKIEELGFKVEDTPRGPRLEQKILR